MVVLEFNCLISGTIRIGRLRRFGYGEVYSGRLAQDLPRQSAFQGIEASERVGRRRQTGSEVRRRIL